MKKILLWLACFPAGMIGGLLVLVVYQLLGSRFIDEGTILYFIETLFGGALSGAAAVYITAYIAPSHKKWVAFALSVIVVISVIFIYPIIVADKDWGYLLFVIAQDGGAIYVTYLIFKRKITFE